MTQSTHQTDQALQDTVADQLLFMPNIDSHLVVTAAGGVVTLAGDVASLPERLAALEAAERVWGVKSVVDEIVVRTAGTTGATDDDLARSATNMIEWSVEIPAAAVDVEVRDRTITLTGTVTWDFQREAAVRAVRDVRGIKAVTNKITLTEKPNVSIAKDGVEDAIRRSTPLDANAITVDVDGHTLTLAGRVRSATERRQAEQLAWSAAGVAAVANELVIA